MGDGADPTDDALDDALDETLDETLDVGSDDDLVANARRRHGALGGIVAAGMLGLDQVLGRKPREEAPVVVAAPTDPIDIDTDGISVAVDDETSLVAPPLPRTAPKQAPSRRRRRR